MISLGLLHADRYENKAEHAHAVSDFAHGHFPGGTAGGGKWPWMEGSWAGTFPEGV